MSPSPPARRSRPRPASSALHDEGPPLETRTFGPTLLWVALAHVVILGLGFFAFQGRKPPRPQGQFVELRPIGPAGGGASVGSPTGTKEPVVAPRPTPTPPEPETKQIEPEPPKPQPPAPEPERPRLKPPTPPEPVKPTPKPTPVAPRDTAPTVPTEGLKPPPKPAPKAAVTPTPPAPEKPKPAKPVLKEVERTVPGTPAKPEPRPARDSTPPKPSASALRDRLGNRLATVPSTTSFDTAATEPGEGSPGPTKARGSGGGGTGVDGEAQKQAYYTRIHDRFYEAWDRPPELVGQKLSAILKIRVNRDGSIVSSSLQSSSGDERLDASIRAAAAKVTSLGKPLPDAFATAPADITVNFEL